MDKEQLRMQFLAGLITENEYLKEIKSIPKGQKIQYAKGKQPTKEAYMVEYSDHQYNPSYCVVSNDEDLTDTFLISKSWIKSSKNI
jgi:hypothetical protein